MQARKKTQLKGQGEEYVKRYFPLFPGERFEVYKLNFFSCIVFFFITRDYG